VLIDGPAGRLEARVEDPAPGSGPRVVGVVCHPHPLFGGTLQNKVVHTLARTLQELAAPTVRFNFRGVGASEGVHDDGRGEVDDALAVIAWARARWECEPLWLAGFSFGAAVALHACATARPAALVTVAPPVKRPDRTGNRAGLSMAHRAGGSRRSRRLSRRGGLARLYMPPARLSGSPARNTSSTVACTT
jgi:alpha/beta superfamily hydrolase